jgi:hypothetical protein
MDARKTQLDNPRSLLFGPDGRLYIADSGNDRIVAVNVETHRAAIVAARNGAQTDPPAKRLAISMPAFTFDRYGRLYIADGVNSVYVVNIRTGEVDKKIDALRPFRTGKVDKRIDEPEPSGPLNYRSFELPRLKRPDVLTFGSNGRLYVGESGPCRLWTLDINSDSGEVIAEGPDFNGIYALIPVPNGLLVCSARAIQLHWFNGLQVDPIISSLMCVGEKDGEIVVYNNARRKTTKFSNDTIEKLIGLTYKSRREIVALSALNRGSRDNAKKPGFAKSIDLGEYGNQLPQEVKEIIYKILRDDVSLEEIVDQLQARWALATVYEGNPKLGSLLMELPALELNS